MKTTWLENGLLAVSVFVFGIMAGFFWTYSFNVNYAMLEMNGEIYATVQSAFNRNVRHWIFFTFFFGGGWVSLIALAGNWRHRKAWSFRLLALACLLYVLGIIVFTKQVNLPLNAYTESWVPSAVPEDWQQIRVQWNQANLWRVWVSVLAFLLGLFSLLLRCQDSPVSVDKRN